MMKLRWIMRSLAVVASLLLLTSCWDSRELNNLGIVIGMGMDKVPDSDDYRLTFQVVNPSATSMTPGSSAGQPSITIYSASDRTMIGAFAKTSKIAARQLFFAHTQVFVIGESIAREGIDGIFDVFERTHELRVTTNVLVSRDSDAATLMKVLLPIETLPAVGIEKRNKNTSDRLGESKSVNVFDMIKGMGEEGGMVISGARIIGDAEEAAKKSGLEETKVKALISMSGLGVFKKGVLLGWLDGAKARGTLWIQNKLKETIINVDSDQLKDSIAISILHSKTNIKADLHNGKATLYVDVKESGEINEARSFVELSKREVIDQLQKEAAQQTKKEITEALQAAQSMKCDIFEFGNELKRTNPKAWDSVKDDWESVFAQADLDVSVEAFIRNVGMRLNPIPIKGK